MKTMVILLMLAGLGGCAAMSEAECRAGDWYGVGERDGRDGRRDQLGDYAEACQKARIIPNAAEYSRGRERGLRAYCTPENGYRVGRAGESYANVCAPELQGAFLREYQRGHDRYELKRELDDAENTVARLGREISELNDKAGKASNEDEKRKLHRSREDKERERRDVRIRLTILQAKWAISGD
ncbi:DUF2799 domain-containing protein [Chitinimonas sp.]|uniref:DUF2799 domain-containing protein n=1 Tax=Chitinimonas sp. TaxID=1934313 RepID=UPI0035B0785C